MKNLRVSPLKPLLHPSENGFCSFLGIFRVESLNNNAPADHVISGGIRANRTEPLFDSKYKTPDLLGQVVSFTASGRSSLAI